MKQKKIKKMKKNENLFFAVDEKIQKQKTRTIKINILYDVRTFSELRPSAQPKTFP